MNKVLLSFALVFCVCVPVKTPDPTPKHERIRAKVKADLKQGRVEFEKAYGKGEANNGYCDHRR